MHIPVLYRDDDIVVVDKPAGVPTHAPDAADPYPYDAFRLVQRQLRLPYLGMHQRLDAETSGVLLFSARPDANPTLAAAFERRTARKTYLALTQGAPHPHEGIIEAPIVRDRDGRYRVTSATDPRGQQARTRYRLLESAGALRCALVEASPETGRSHQIRVHLAQAGAPVLGDPLYGSEQPVAPRLCLHARDLELPHPTTGQRVLFSSPLPAIFDAARPEGVSARAALALAARATHVRTMADTPEGLRTLMAWAAERRSPLTANPSTSIYRVIHGETDGLPGLTADRYGDALVVSLYDDGQGSPPPIPSAMLDSLLATTNAASIYVKYRPRQASRVAEEQLAALAPSQPAAGPHLGELAAHEDGLAYLIRPGDGLNAGLFPDMREGRGRVRAWSAGRRVLNCFAYTCGFGVAATAGGAERVLNLDLSKTVLARGRENYHINGFESDPHDFVFGDVFDWLQRLARRSERFDLVILDPPGFSTTKAGRFSAAHDYGRLAALAARCVTPDGLLLACCNVAEVPWRKHRDQVVEGVKSIGRTAEVMGIYHEPTLDFPHFARREPFLKMLLLAVGG